MPFVPYRGTFNRSQFERFISFARKQLPVISARIEQLDAERARVGAIAFLAQDDKGVPTAWQASPSDSYLAKLLGAYEALGGQPQIHIRLRNRTQPIYIVQSTESDAPAFMSNGEVIGNIGLSDGKSAELVRQAMTWLDDTIAYRFDKLERKIRRALDYSDQLQIEKTRLQTIRGAATAQGSLEFVAEQINQLFGDRNYRTIYDDNDSDPLGYRTYSQFASYDGGGSRVVTDPQRANEGYQGPGQGGEGTA